MNPDQIMMINAIKSIFELIMLVDSDTLRCRILDYDKDIKGIKKGVSSFEDFCDGLCENIHPQDREDFISFMTPEHFTAGLKERMSVSIECRIRQENRRYYWTEMIFIHADKEDEADGNNCLFMIRDINDRKKKDLAGEKDLRKKLKILESSYEELFEDNMKDEQTGCYNRKGLNYYVEKTLRETIKEGLCIFVCMADLNGLKHINHTYGHPAGDTALSVISSILIRYAPKDSRIVRVGGDEFLIFAPIRKDSRQPLEMEKNVDLAVEEYNKDHDGPFEVGVSYGWVVEEVTDDRNDIDDLIEEADQKMYGMRRVRDKYRRDP